MLRQITRATIASVFNIDEEAININNCFLYKLSFKISYEKNYSAATQYLFTAASSTLF